MIKRALRGACAGCVLLLALSAAAQDLSGRTVDEIRLQGLARASEQLIRSKLEVQTGQPLNPGAVARDLRRLYELGYFDKVTADASLENGRLVLTYVVQERRVIEEIRIAGNDKVRTRLIRGAMSWKEGDSFSREAYPEERDAILKLYQSKGFPNASVDIQAEELAGGRVRLTYVIDEGRKSRIKSMAFEGNTVLSDRELRKLMKTKRSKWFLGGKYDESTFETDLQNILDKYGDHGRLEAAIAKTDFSYRESGKGVDVTVYISEGPEYRVDNLEVAGNQAFDDDEVLRLLKVKPGDVHNKGQVKADADLVSKGYEDSGYINATVTPQVTLDRDRKTTFIVYRIQESDLRYIKEVKITGNTVTRDEVIRRDVLAKPGERFDGSALRASQRALDNSGYFDSVRLTMENVPEDDRSANLLLDVDEGKTGFFDFGVGYSTEEKLGGYTELRLKNFDLMNWPTFSGGGQQFRARIQVGDVRTQYSLSFTDPEIGGYPVALGFDVFDESYDYQGGSTYSEDTRGGQIRLGKVLSPYVSARTALRYTDVKIEDLPRLGYPTLRRERGDGVTVSSIWGINRNTVDIQRDPTSGASHDFQVEVAGIGGDYNYVKLEHDTQWYWSVSKDKKWILSYRTRQGWVNEYGSSDYVPISARYFAGGTSTVRGYDTRDIGPKERRFIWFGDKEAIGGELRLLNSVELKYKVTDMFRVYTFVDSGGVWAEAGDFSLGDVKYSAGVGFGVDVPRMGPIRVDYGIPLNPDDDQGSGRLHLTTGFRF